MQDEHGNAKPFVAGMLIGALVGAGIALLFAPQSGEDTRRLIRRRARKLADAAREKYEEMREKTGARS